MHRTLVTDHLKKIKAAGNYNRYPDISDRKSWNALPDKLKAELIKDGERAKKKPWTQLLISDFTEFTKSGNRVQFEDKYFPRRRKLNALVMAECVENKGRFLDDILDGLYLILEESSWCLPPHNSYVRDAKQEPLPDVTRPIIDLFDAETGAEVAFCEYLLRPVFDQVSPFISTYVDTSLRERIFEPYMNTHFWWMGNGKEPMCNWTVWCTQNVLICTLTRRDGFFTEKEKLEYIKKAAASCDYFLDEYGDDGGCDEGASYYTHAGLCLFGCLELIAEAAGESFRKVFSESLIRNIATYIVKMHVSGDYYINFADCSARPGGRTAREFLFGRAVEDEALTGFAAKDVRKQKVSEQLITEEINLFYHVQQAFAYEEIMNYREGAVLPEDVYFKSLGLMVARDKTFVLAAKAGDNADSHNHNDVGSFTIYKKGKPFIIDLGVGTYTAKTFSDKRYELWTMQSQFHNLPTFLDISEKELEAADTLFSSSEKDLYNKKLIMEKDGEDYRASRVTCLLCKNMIQGVSSLKMELAGAYGSHKVKSYTREATLNKGKNITVTDSYQGAIPYVMSLMTYEEPVATRAKDGSFLIKVGKLGTIKVSGAKHAFVSEYPIEDERLKKAWKHQVYRILLASMPGAELKMIFE